MALSRIAAMHAAEIALMDWSDSPYRADRAGHDRNLDGRGKMSSRVLSQQETDTVRANVMWVTAQVLAYMDPNFSINEFAKACGVHMTPGILANGLRTDEHGAFHAPGTFEA